MCDVPSTAVFFVENLLNAFLVLFPYIYYYYIRLLAVAVYGRVCAVLPTVLRQLCFTCVAGSSLTQRPTWPLARILVLCALNLSMASKSLLMLWVVCFSLSP
jgi:hypothetical protein